MYVRMDAKRSQASETHLGTPTIKILPLFQQGGSIQEMVRDCLAADQPDPLGLPIRVCNYNEELHTLDNRRLAAKTPSKRILSVLF